MELFSHLEHNSEGFIADVDQRDAVVSVEEVDVEGWDDGFEPFVKFEAEGEI